MAKTDSSENKPAASRITHSAALKKTGTGPRKANVLGAKKPNKLGVRKITSDVSTHSVVKGSPLRFTNPYPVRI